MAKLGSKWPAARRKQQSENLKKLHGMRKQGLVENEICPVDGEIAQAEYSAIYKNNIVNFCSGACRDDFKKNPTSDEWDFHPRSSPYRPKKPAPESTLDKHETLQEVKMEMIQQLSSDLSATACLKLAKFFIEKAETDN